MEIWRVQLKPDPEKGISYEEVLDFCKREQIIGVGWCLVETHIDDYDTLKQEIESIPQYKGDNDKYTAAIKAINAVRGMSPGDLVWTRLGGNASDYYLFRVGEQTWTDRIVTENHRKHDIGNFVSARWVHIGTEDKVPGKVVNAFCARGTAQRVYDVELISKVIWNKYCSISQEKYEVQQLSMDEFWTSIGSEELECLILLYIQKLGYYLISSTLKLSTARYEAIMLSQDGSHKALPQVKRNEELDAEQYADDVKNGDHVFLFTTSEKYGSRCPQGVHCISKVEIEEFIAHNYSILPDSIKYWVDMVK